MEYIQSILENTPVIQFTDILDIAIVAFLIYKLLPIFRSTGTAKIAWIVVAILVATWLAELLNLNTLNFILSQLIAVGLFAIVIIFQPEIRRIVDQVSNIKFREFLSTGEHDREMVNVIDQTVKACEVMSREKVGALIVFARHNSLEEYFKTGTLIDGKVSEQLIRNIFFPRASLHDGALIIRDGRVSAAGCVLPLSETERLHADLGTRHRAAVGMSEVSDAVIVVVSEETGAISVAIGGMLKRHLAPQTLQRLLFNELCPEKEQQEQTLVLKLRQKLQKRDKEGKKNEK